jgi:hypothetical protein
MTPRERMEQAMQDSGTTVRITRAGAGTPTLNEATGDLVQPAAVDVYAGKAMVNAVNRTERTTIRGGEQETSTGFQVSVPIAAGPFRIGDEVVVQTSGADPHMVGMKLWVVQIPTGSYVSRQRLLCSRVQGGPQ